MVRRRAVIAVVLSFLVPGLGHAYIRRWVRAVGFGVLAGAVILFFDPTFDTTGSPAQIAESVWTSLSLEANLVMSVVEFGAMLDVYLLVTASPEPNEATSCPNCGRELDDELAFCPWCAQKLTPE